MHHSQNKWQAVTAYVFSQMGDIPSTQGKTSMSRRPKSRTRRNKIRSFIWSILDTSRFTASHCRIHIHGRGQTRNVNSRRFLALAALLCLCRSLRSSRGADRTEDRSSVMVYQEAVDSASTNIEVLSFNHNQPIRFRINNPPSGNDAWVGIYPFDAEDREHDDRWKWLRDIELTTLHCPDNPKEWEHSALF